MTTALEAPRPTRIVNIPMYDGIGFYWDFEDSSIPDEALVFMRVYSKRNFKGEQTQSIWAASKNELTGFWEFNETDESVLASDLEHGSIYKLYCQDDKQDKNTRRMLPQAGRLVYR